MVHPSYQPSKAELEEDMRVKATVDEAVKALTRPVIVTFRGRSGRADCGLNGALRGSPTVS